MTLQRINNSRGHWYKIDGKKADGVTTLIGNGMRKQALEYWSANATADYATDNWDQLSQLSPSKRNEELRKARFKSRDEAARRGTEVHDLAEKLLHGEEVDVPDAIAGHVEAAVRFLDDYQVQPVLTESPVASRKGNYAGTLDMVFRTPLLPGRTIIADWKTNRTGIYGETALQLAAYRYADIYLDGDTEKPMSDLNITDAWAVWIRADGYEVYEMDAGQQAFTTFKYVATVARQTGKQQLDSLKLRTVELPSVKEPAA